MISSLFLYSLCQLKVLPNLVLQFFQDSTYTQNHILNLISRTQEMFEKKISNLTLDIIVSTIHFASYKVFIFINFRAYIKEQASLHKLAEREPKTVFSGLT